MSSTPKAWAASPSSFLPIRPQPCLSGIRHHAVEELHWDAEMPPEGVVQEAPFPPGVATRLQMQQYQGEVKGSSCRAAFPSLSENKTQGWALDGEQTTSTYCAAVIRIKSRLPACLARLQEQTKRRRTQPARARASKDSTSHTLHHHTST
eukprot:CAMPEP_0117691570 /NCGR_PEP_ID=MMETSP0804-20121206/25798_1 /TAXON_ID=1074897 /ORGANISM="Tetraselmis astigmatica, Strain CCMP880" /LENGTH=149 /DNA_ID=CAMNT_0005504827 /DNA_START=163 /DNA_END=613 /DNA_ORIENTATION=-